MKTNPLLTLLTLTGATFTLAIPAAFPQEAVRSDTSGKLLTPLSLGSTQFTGKLSPDHLGTGTPTSATVLRGDGTWAATTPTGATIASTGTLLMGDSTGNASSVSSATDLLGVIQARLELAVSEQPAPTNLLLTSTWNGSASVGLYLSSFNADGTITIPANGELIWIVSTGDGTSTLYGYVVATTELPRGAVYMYAHAGVDQPHADSTPLPGVYRSTFTAQTNGGNPYDVHVKNTTSVPIVIYAPALCYQDNGLALLASDADATAVAAPSVADLDFTRFADADRSARYQLEKLTTLAADGVNGSADNAGTLYAPKLTLQQTVTTGSVFGLYRGSTFRESLRLPTSTTHGIVVQDVALGSVKALPVVSALDPVDNGAVTSNGDGTYSYLWTPTDSTIDNGGYANVYAVEINTATEAATPVASRRRMTDTSAQSAVAALPGAVCVQPPGTGSGQSGSPTQWKAVFHPSEGINPSQGDYRYEVVSRLQPANWGSFDSNAGDGAMSGLELVGGSSGYGCLSAPRGFAGDRLAFIHASTHNAVIGGGSLQRSVFYESGDLANGSGPSIQLAWYASTGTGLRWVTNNSLFYMNVGDRYANGIISHTSGSTNFDRGDIADCAFLGARWSNGSLQGTAIDYVNVAAGTINRVYVQGVRDAFGTQMPLAAEVENSVFRGVQRLLIAENFHDNIVQTVNGADPVNYVRFPNACIFQQSGASATNNLFWARTDTTTGLSGDDQAAGIGFFSGGLTNCTFSRNIVVLEPKGAGASPTYISEVSSPNTMNVDHNLVINLAKGGFHASVGGPEGKPSWASYLAYESTAGGYDQHSLYLDLSTDPRGLKAVFADPANGDFRWAQTQVARRCAAYCRANHVGPASMASHWPFVPTVDEAMRLVTDL